MSHIRGKNRGAGAARTFEVKNERAFAFINPPRELLPCGRGDRNFKDGMVDESVLTDEELERVITRTGSPLSIRRLFGN